MRNLRELEDLIIEAVYTDIIQGKLDQRNQLLEVDFCIGRDIRKKDINNIVKTLHEWWGCKKEGCAIRASAWGNVFQCQLGLPGSWSLGTVSQGVGLHLWLKLCGSRSHCRPPRALVVLLQWGDYWMVVLAAGASETWLLTWIQCFANSASELDEAQEVSVDQIPWIREPMFSISNLGLVLAKHCEGSWRQGMGYSKLEHKMYT